MYMACCWARQMAAVISCQVVKAKNEFGALRMLASLRVDQTDIGVHTVTTKHNNKCARRRQ